MCQCPARGDPTQLWGCSVASCASGFGQAGNSRVVTQLPPTKKPTGTRAAVPVGSEVWVVKCLLGLLGMLPELLEQLPGVAARERPPQSTRIIWAVVTSGACACLGEAAPWLPQRMAVTGCQPPPRGPFVPPRGPGVGNDPGGAGSPTPWAPSSGHRQGSWVCRSWLSPESVSSIDPSTLTPVHDPSSGMTPQCPSPCSHCHPNSDPAMTPTLAPILTPELQR